MREGKRTSPASVLCHGVRLVPRLTKRLGYSLHEETRMARYRVVFCLILVAYVTRLCGCGVYMRASYTRVTMDNVLSSASAPRKTTQIRVHTARNDDAGVDERMSGRAGVENGRLKGTR